MTIAEMKLALFRSIDKLRPEQLTEIYDNLSALLNVNETNLTEEEIKFPDYVERGLYKIGMKPSDFAGIWEGPIRNADQIRKEAWVRKS